MKSCIVSVNFFPFNACFKEEADECQCERPELWGDVPDSGKLISERLKRQE